MNFLASPNLPRSLHSEPGMRVMLVSARYPFVAEDLERLGVLAIPVEAYAKLPEPVACHPDLVCHHLGGNRILVYPGNPALDNALKKLGMELLRPTVPAGKKYPADTALCAARMGDRLFCRESSTDPVLLRECGRVRNVRQGYAKCSTLIVDERSAITSDAGIAAALEEEEMEALLISPGKILLEGYDTGFIGGCGGKISRDRMYFTGKLRHPDAVRIRKFLEIRGIEPVEGSGEELIDVGSLLPLTE